MRQQSPNYFELVLFEKRTARRILKFNIRCGDLDLTEWGWGQLNNQYIPIGNEKADMPNFLRQCFAKAQLDIRLYMVIVKQVGCNSKFCTSYQEINLRVGKPFPFFRDLFL